MAYYVLPQDRGPGHDYRMQNQPGYADSVNSNVSLPSSMKTGSATNNSSQTVPQETIPDLDQLYLNNLEWAEEQAQKQMDFQSSANKIAMDYASAEADKERAFETEMANTAYQRAVADLKKAGLNPILAYSQGGASVPSVSSPAGITSAGSKATSSDTGYTKYQLDYAYQKMIVNSATSIATSLIGLLK